MFASKFGSETELEVPLSNREKSVSKFHVSLQIVGLKMPPKFRLGLERV
jgi:hypothetical protein